MATFIYSALANNASLTFNPTVDILIFDGGISAHHVSFINTDYGSSGGGGVVIEHGGSVKEISLIFTPGYDETNIYKISSSHFQFSDGSVALIGDNTTGVGDDTTTVTLNGTNGNDYLLTAGGSQILNGGDGDDMLGTIGGKFGGTGGGGSGNDVFNGGNGTDTLYLDEVDGYTQYTVNLATGQGTIAAGVNSSTFTLSSIENILGSKVSDIIIGDSNNNLLYGYEGNDTLTGGAGNDTLDGGSGIDTAIYRSNLANYTLTKGAGSYTVRDNTATDGTDTLTNVERLQFSDAKLAIDLDGNAGTTVKILGAVFGAPSVANKEYVGIGLNLLDGGMSYENLMQLAINVRLGANATSTEVVNLLYTNVVGTPPGLADLAYFRDLLDQGVFTQASLGVMAAETSLNQGNVDLVGLSSTGIEFI